MIFKDIFFARAYGMRKMHVRRKWPIRGRVYLIIEPLIRKRVIKLAGER